MQPGGECRRADEEAGVSEGSLELIVAKELSHSWQCSHLDSGSSCIPSTDRSRCRVPVLRTEERGSCRCTFGWLPSPALLMFARKQALVSNRQPNPRENP